MKSILLKTRPVDKDYRITAKPGAVGPRWEHAHNGYDFGAARDSVGKIIKPIMLAPVYSVLDGEVQIAGRHTIYDVKTKVFFPGPLGLRVWVICNHNGLHVRFGYCHLNKILVREEDVVKEGQILGYVGTTGNSTAPHLHFQPETWPQRELLNVEFAEIP